MEVGRCADCHNPHASAQDHLVKLPAGGECYDCHDDKFPDKGESAHSVISLIGCRACHEPHGGSRPALLREDPDQLCLSCHDPGKAGVEEDSPTTVLLDRFTVDTRKIRNMPSLRLSADGQRGHPVANHRVLGTATEEELKHVETTFSGELHCLTCHDPHKGRFDLLKWKAAGSLQACINCHPK